MTLPFEVNDYVRWRLMNGYDDIDLTLQHEDDIAAYEKMRAEKFPFKPKTIPAKHWPEEKSSPPASLKIIGRARWPTAALSNSLHRINKVSLAAHQ